ncbi:MAG: autotransporter domain-containing protein [Phenylobacterium sp.]|nr:autotransporter domain-containing protein [Phenylobacterium sp.]
MIDTVTRRALGLLAALILTPAAALAAPPGAPTIGTATAGDTQATVTFTAPASNGGKPISVYIATASPGGQTGSCAGPTACTITIGSLTNGEATSFTVTAANDDGPGLASAASNSVIPKSDQIITFPQPSAYNFGATPTLTASSRYAAGGGATGLPIEFTSSTTSVCTVTLGGALTFRTAGACTIDADQPGNGSTNAATTLTRSFTVNAVAPGAPTIGTATAGDGQATATFSPPSSNGGAPITSYRVTSDPGGHWQTGAGSPITVTGLTTGVSYTFTVTATNAAALTSAASLASNAVTAKSAQTITFANPGSQNFGTSPDLRVVNGGASSTSALDVSFTSSTTGVCTVTSAGVLTFLTVGACTINADQAGDFQYGAATQVSRSFTVNAIVPGAPTSVVATAGDTQASVAFVAPTNTGGTTITGYTVTVSPADVAPVNSAGSPVVITGLSNRSPYTFTVTADNSAGTGPASSASNSVTPAQTQIITFNNPGAQNFGTTPTLTATSDSGLTVYFSSSTTGVCTITTGGALTFRAAGTCTINADQAGDALWLAAPQVVRNFVVNAVAPGAPTITTVGPGDGQVSLAFTPPSNTGGGTITGYTVTINPGGRTAACGPTPPCVITGLTNGVAYSFTLTATNGVGGGSSSGSSAPVAPVASEPVQVGQTISGLAANPAAPVFAPGGTFSVSATGGGGSSPVTFAIAPASSGVCTISGTSVTMLAAGTCTITADQAADATHLAAPSVSLSVVIGAATPSLSWSGDLTKTLGDPDFELADPTSDSKGAFSFASSDPAVARVAGRTVTLTGPGTAVLTASQAEDGDYAGASIALTLSVTARPNPAVDPTVAAAGQSQVDAAVRFAGAQQANIQTRLRSLRSNSGGAASPGGLTFNLHSAGGRDVSLPTGGLMLGDGGGLPEGWGLWTAGALVFDERGGGDGFAGFDVRSEGISVGLDRRLNERLTVGAAAGLGWNDTDFGGSPSGMDGQQGSLSAYGLWRAGENLFVDGLLGWGRLDFDLTRWSDEAGALARASRSGDQWFGSLTLGYEQRRPRGSLTGYGRLDASRTSLEAYRESGLGGFDLNYREQTIDSSSLALGVEGSRLFKQDAFAWRPFWLVEYRGALQNNGDQAINYVLNPATSDFVLSMRSFNDDALVLGAGVDVDLPAGWLLSLSYRREDGSESQSDGYAVSVTYRGERK